PGAELSAPPLNPPETASADVEALKKQITELATRLVESFPNSPEALRISGLVYNALGKKAKALEFWKKALRLDPSRSDLYVQLAMVAQLQGEHEKAADLCRAGLAKAVP